MSSKKKNKSNAQQDTVGMVRSALVGKVPALRELEKKLGLKEFERRCAVFLEAIFEPNESGKSVTAENLKAKAKANVEKPLKPDVPAKGKVDPKPGVGYGMGVENIKKAVEAGKKPIMNQTSRLMGDPKADKEKLDAAVKRHIEESRQQHHTRLPASVRLTPHEIALNLGSFMTKEQAQHDAAELLSFARAIWNRSAVFPSPSRYGVQPHVEAAQPVKRSDRKFTAPWTVNVTIAISGDDKKCAAWGENVYSRNRGDQE